MEEMRSVFGEAVFEAVFGFYGRREIVVLRKYEVVVLMEKASC